MNIIIAGAGSVGRYMANQLAKSGHHVLIIDNDAKAVNKARLDETVSVLFGDACEIDTLTKSGAMDADVMAAVTGDDEDNLVIALLAKQEFAVPRVVGRVNNPNNEWMFNETWGVDVSVSTPHLLTALVEEAVNVGSFVRILTFEQGRTQLAEVTLAEGSPAINRPIGELDLPRETTVVAVVRDGHVVTPSPELILRVSDEVLLLIGAGGDEVVKRALCSPRED